MIFRVAVDAERKEHAMLGERSASAPPASEAAVDNVLAFQVLVCRAIKSSYLCSRLHAVVCERAWRYIF